MRTARTKPRSGRADCFRHCSREGPGMREQLIRSPALGKVDIELAGNYGAAQAAAMHGDQCSGHLGEVTPSRPSGPVTAPPDASASVSASSGGVPAFSEASPTISGGAAAPVIGESPLSFEE